MTLSRCYYKSSLYYMGVRKMLDPAMLIPRLTIRRSSNTTALTTKLSRVDYNDFKVAKFCQYKMVRTCDSLALLTGGYSLQL